MTDKAELLVTAAAFIATGLFASPQKGEDNASASGPDVTVLNLVSVSHFGEDGGIHAYAVGIAVCNVGDQPLWWCGTQRPYCDEDQHPVIAQNLYRLRDGRFEQLGDELATARLPSDKRVRPRLRQMYRAAAYL